MLELRGNPTEGNLFEIIVRGRWRSLSASWFNSMLKQYCVIPKVTSHSLQNRFKVAEVKQRGLWKSSCVYEYLSLRVDQAMARDRVFSLRLP